MSLKNKIINRSLFSAARRRNITLTWYNSTESASNNTLVTGGVLRDWIPVSITTGGICRTLRAHINTITLGPFGMKLALYNSAGNLIAGAHGEVSVSSSNDNTLVSITGLSGSVSAGTNYIAITFDSAAGGSVKSVTSVGQGPYQASVTYASFPQATLGSPNGNEDEIMIVGVQVES